MSVRIQDRNGVKVRVHEHPNGTTVEADCQCFGSPLRLHSNLDCPVRLGVSTFDQARSVSPLRVEKKEDGWTRI